MSGDVAGSSSKWAVYKNHNVILVLLMRAFDCMSIGWVQGTLLHTYYQPSRHHSSTAVLWRHTFDQTTLKVFKSVSSIRIVLLVQITLLPIS